MQDNEKKPALRFKGFTDPWEQRKLGEICRFHYKRCNAIQHTAFHGNQMALR